MNEFSDDILVISEYVNSVEKENILISLINRLRQFNIPILLVGHYPVNPEIQKMVDYYFFDKKNPVVYPDEIKKYENKSKVVWMESALWRIDISVISHDYTVWASIRNAVNVVKYLNKKNIHFMEYDNLPDLERYKNEFILPLKDHDVSVFDIPGHKKYVTFLFSIKTDIALNVFNRIKTQDEYYTINGNDFPLEDVFFRCLNDVTNNIYISKYIGEHGKDLDLHNITGGESISHYLLCDEKGKLFYSFSMPNDANEFTVIIDYNGDKKEYVVNQSHQISDFKIFLLEIGDYKMGETSTVYYKDKEISRIELNMEWEKYREYNKITFKK
jgi:hypothetical protein